MVNGSMTAAPGEPVTTDSIQAELEKLRAAMAGLEAQRAMLSEAIVGPALAALSQQLSTLEARAAQAAPAVEEERRILTALFSDIVGSTSLAEKLDPEDWRAVVAAVHAMAGRVVQQRGGTVLQYLGDGLLAAFGAEIPSERDPQNAISAALDIQAGIAALQTGQPIQLRIGVHTGLVVVGAIGSEVKREFTAIGDTMNLAARLQSIAPPGGIVISHDTYRHVRGVFDVTTQPPIKVKGKTEPVQTYIVRRARPRPFRTVTRGIAGIETRTVGRDAELARLKAALTSTLQERKVTWAQIVGEPGIGKSRLLGEMMEYLTLQPEELGVMKARASQGDEKQAYALIRRAWFDLFQIAEDERLADAEARWMSKFLALRGASFEEAAHALGLLVGLPFMDSPYIGAMRHDPAQVKGRAIVVSRELLASIRARTHIVILLEDAHWADASSWDYVMQVVLGAEAGPHGLFVLSTARPDWDPPAGLLQYSGYMQVNLTSLPDAACRELVLELLQSVKGAPDHVIQMIVQRSEGVPYYAEEMINLFLDRGIIDQSQSPWRFDSARLDESPLPATLQHLLHTRLSSLPEAERVALQRGAIFGRHFWEGGVAALGARASDRVMGPLQSRGFVLAQLESSLAGESEWSFHHNLLHEVTYESVLKRDRKALHKAAASWLEAQARRAERLDEFTAVLGQHAERACEWIAAADWYLRAGERAQARGAVQEARTFYERALALVPPDDRQRRWRAMLGRSDMAARLGEREEHRTSVTALLELAEGLDDTCQATAHYRHALYLDHQGDYRAALQAYEVALASARRAQDRALCVSVMAMRLICQNRLGELSAAAAAAQEVLACAHEVNEVTRAKALSNLAVYYVESGDLARAAQLHSEQADINHQLGDRGAEANALVNLGYDYVCLGMPAAARPPLEQAIKILQAIGARREIAYARLNLGLAYWRSGESQAARQVLEQVQGELAALGDVFARAAGLSYLGLAHEQSGDVAGAIERFAQAREMFNAIGVQGYAADACAGLARGALAQEDVTTARERAQAVWKHVQQQGAQGMEFPVRAYLTCADAFAALGESKMSCAAVEEGYHELIRRADKISNADWRASFLDNVQEHRALAERWKQLAGQRAGEPFEHIGG